MKARTFAKLSIGAAAALCLAYLVASLVCCRDEVDAKAFRRKLSQLAQETASSLESSTLGVLDEAELPRLCRLRCWLRSTTSSRPFPELVNQKETYLIRAADDSLSLAVVIVQGNIYAAVLTAPEHSDQLARRWLAELKHIFPEIPVKLVRDTE
jgi:hypothetical protein